MESNITKKLVERFGKDILHNSCMWYGDGEQVLRKLIRRLNINIAVEIGTCFGLSTAVLAQYAKKVYTYDIRDFEEKYRVWGFLEKKNIEFIEVYNENQKRAHIRNLGLIDLAFIDGEHWQNGCTDDYEYCKHARFILFHDYNEIHHDVVSFVDKLEGKKEIGRNFVLYYNKP